MNTLHIPKATFIGSSWGGGYALYFTKTPTLIIWGMRDVIFDTLTHLRRWHHLGLAEQREPEAALRAYEAHRMKRSAAIIEQSYLFGEIGQWEHPLLNSLRDGLTPVAFATFLPRRFVANVRLPA